MYTKIKQHIQNHKEAYIVGVTVAGITYLIMRDYDCSAVQQMPKKCCGEVDANAQTIMDSIFIGGNNYGNATNNTSPQPLSYIVSQEGTNNWWKSQAAYARERGLSDSTISMHINHGRPLPNGETLIREGIAN